MSTNPLNPSFRKLHVIPKDAAHPSVRQFARDTDKSITDLNQSVRSFESQMSALSKAASSSATTLIENISSETTAGTVTGGVVNNQSGITAYATQQSDNAGLIILDDASSIAATLTSTVTIPYYTTITNAGVSTVTVTPSSGLVNGLASIDIPGGSFATIFFDGSDWWADAPGSSVVPPGSITRTPHDVTGSRSFGSIFQNTTGQEMLVTGWGITTGGLTSELSALIDTVNPPIANPWGDEYTASVSGGKAGFNFTVPNGYFYELVLSGTGAITSLGKWVEYF